MNQQSRQNQINKLIENQPSSEISQENKQISNFDPRLIQIYFEWFSDGYEDIENLKTFNPAVIKDLMGNIDDPEEKIRVGSLVMVFRFLFYWGLESEILRQNDHLVENNITLDRDFIEEVCFNLVEFLKDGEHKNCQYSIFVILEVLMLVSKASNFLKEPENMYLYINLLINYEEPQIRAKCAKFLFGLGSVGISAIVEICQENETLKKEIVTHLINSPLVIETIIVPALLNKFHSADHQIQHKAVTALSKLGCLSSKSESIPILLDLLKNSTLNKNLICGALRSFGDEGLQALIEAVGIKLYDNQESIDNSSLKTSNRSRFSHKNQFDSKSKKIKNPKLISIVAFFLGCKVGNDFLGKVNLQTLDGDGVEI